MGCGASKKERQIIQEQLAAGRAVRDASRAKKFAAANAAAEVKAQAAQAVEAQRLRELEARDAKQTAAYEKRKLEVDKSLKRVTASRTHRVVLDVSLTSTAAECVFTDVKDNESIAQILEEVMRRDPKWKNALAEATASAKAKGGAVDAAVLGVRVDGVVIEDLDAVYEYRALPLVLITGLQGAEPTAEELQRERELSRRSGEAMMSMRDSKLKQRENALNAKLLPFACDKNMCSDRFYLETDLERHCTVENCKIRAQEQTQKEIQARRDARIVGKQYQAMSNAVNARNKAKMDTVLRAEAAREKTGAEYRRNAANAQRSKVQQRQREDDNAAYFGMKIRR